MVLLTSLLVSLLTSLLTSTFVWVVIGFCAGSLPFSLWIGERFLGKDIRGYGDANPGATNVLRAGGRVTYAFAVLLDFLKGTLPVAAAREIGASDGWGLVLVGMAPILGHAFSPILRFRGGKAVAVTAGVWCGLTAWEGPLVGSVLLTVFTLMVGGNGKAVLGAMAGVLLYFCLTPAPILRADLWPTLIGLWCANVLLLGWTHRADFDLLGGAVDTK